MKARHLALVLGMLLTRPLDAVPPIDTRKVDKLLQQLAPETQMDAVTAKQRLVELRTQAKTPKERALIGNMIALAELTASERADPEKMVAGYRDVLRDLAALAPEDPAVQVMVVSQLDQLSLSAEDGDRGPISKEVRQRWDELGSRFPRSAEVHAGRAFAGERIGLSMIAVARELGRCIELGQGKLSQRCVDLLARYAEAYERPFCSAANVDRRFRVVGETATGHEVRLGTEILHVGDDVLIGAADLVEVRRETMHVETRDEAGVRSSRDEETCGIDLSPTAAPRIRKASEARRAQGVTTSTGWRAGKMVFLLGEEALVAADTTFTGLFPARLSISNGRSGTDCFRICARAEHRQLPAELRRLLPVGAARR